MQFSADPKPISCLICGGSSPLFGVVDFHKSCLELHGVRLPSLGIPIYYRRCAQCGFVFCDTMKDWTHADFRRHIYNADYIVVDPDLTETRPRENAQKFMDTFPRQTFSGSILDYGAGNGRFAEILTESGYDVTCYDPFGRWPRPMGKFDIITAFEVLEHTPRPLDTLRDVVSLLKDDGLFMFSVLAQPAVFDEQGVNWWYVAPRNGHVSIYSIKSLYALFGFNSMRCGSLSQQLHISFKNPPAFAQHLLSSA